MSPSLSVKITSLLIALTASVYGQNFAVWYLGPNTNAIATNWPAYTKSIGTNTSFKGADDVLSSAQLSVLKSNLWPTYSRWESNNAYASTQRTQTNLDQFNTAVKRMSEWTAYIGTSGAPKSNFVSIAQASQWAREMLWLNQKLLNITKAQYHPEDDD